MDQNILRLTKLHYRNSLLGSVVAGSKAMGDALKKVTLKDAILHLAAAWEKITPQIIEKCWHIILSKPSNMTEDDDDNDDLPLSILQQKLKDDTTDAVVSETITLLQALEPVS